MFLTGWLLLKCVPKRIVTAISSMSFAAPLVSDAEIIKLLRDKTKIPRKDYVIIDVRDHDFAVFTSCTFEYKN